MENAKDLNGRVAFVIGVNARDTKTAHRDR